jgi:hypothetical protein
MKLYLIEPIWDNDKWKPWYDELHGLVVRCESEDRCRQIAHSEGGNEVIREKNYAMSKEKRIVIYSPWLDPEATRVTEITSDGDEEIILRDFNAG